MSEQEHNPLKDKVLTAIKSGEVAMRPKWHFILKTCLVIIGSIVLFLTLIYIVSLIIFILRQNGTLFVPLFGLRGIYIFLVSLPWILILLLVVCSVILEVLVRKYAFAYRRPLVYSALAIILLIFIGGCMVEKTPLQRGVFRYVTQKQIPLMAPMYGFTQKIPRDIHMGRIMIITPRGFDLATGPGERLRVFITPHTQIQRSFSPSVEDFVVVFGKNNRGEIEAIGIKKIDRFEIMK